MGASKDIEINAQNPQNGKTLLMYAVIIGNFDLVKALCNFGSNVSVKDKNGLDALDYALNFGRYKITELVFYRQLSGKTGNDLKRISTEIHTKNKEAEFIKSQRVKSKYDDFETYKAITQFMINAIKERAPFDPSMLFYAWYFNENSLTSPLWSAMMETYEQILSDTKDKKGWKWLKENFLNSLIWFLPHPNVEIVDDEKEILAKYNSYNDYLSHDGDESIISREQWPKYILYSHYHLNEKITPKQFVERENELNEE